MRHSNHRILFAKGLFAFSQEELIEVGAYSLTHPFLSVLPNKLQQDEVERSKSTLEKISGQQARSLAYPYGKHMMEAVTILRESDMTWRAPSFKTVFGAATIFFNCPELPSRIGTMRHLGKIDMDSILMVRKKSISLVP